MSLSGSGLRPARLFQIPESIPYLDTHQLAVLSESFTAWASASKRYDVRLSRSRIRLIYLLIRHTGAKLGEIQTVSERDFNPAGPSLVLGRFRGGAHSTREVPIPEEVAQELKTFFEQVGNGPDVFRNDPGHVRRKFYERGRECGFSQKLCNPSIIRRSRAIEMLRGDIPLPVVRQTLGQGSTDLSALFCRFSSQDQQRIMADLIKREQGRTSARNQFYGTITAIRGEGVSFEVELKTQGGETVVSVVTAGSVASLELKPGREVIADIKAPWVLLARGSKFPPMGARNTFSGKVQEISRGAVLSEVILCLPDSTRICSVLTTRALDSLQLRQGDQAWALVKSFAVILRLE